MAIETNVVAKPLDVVRSHLFEMQSFLQNISNMLGMPPPTEGSGNAAEPTSIQDRILDVQGFTNKIRLRLSDIQEFISMI